VYQVYVLSVYLPVVLGVQMYRAHKWVRYVYLVYVHGVYIPGVQVSRCTGCTSGYEMCTRCMCTVYLYQVYRCPDVLGAPVGPRCVPGERARCIYTRCTRCPDVLGAPVGTRCVPGVCARCTRCEYNQMRMCE
jgi:hypothetical protein